MAISWDVIITDIGLFASGLFIYSYWSFGRASPVYQWRILVRVVQMFFLGNPVISPRRTLQLPCLLFIEPQLKPKDPHSCDALSPV